MDFKCLLIFLLICVFNLNGISSKSVKNINEENPVVCFKGGCVRGKSYPGYLKPFEGFFGIPFAKPPIGDLRLRNPVPIEKWSGILDATAEKPLCMQKNFLIPNPTIQGSEDCLYLYVYRPKNLNPLNRKLPVMIYIHGGGFFAGAGGPSFSGGDYFMDSGDVIMVSIQYRLGPLGFLSSGDDSMSGNFGLKDQALAIKWVRDNIGSFGGDPNLITLWGQSAGAASVHLHMMSPLSKNLFHRAIMLSGSGIAPYNYPLKDPLKQLKDYAKVIGIQTGSNINTDDLAREFRRTSVENILNASEKLKVWSIDPLTLNRNVVEKCTFNERNETTGFLCKDPLELWKNGEYTRMPMLGSHVPEEGAVRALQILVNQTEVDDLNDRFYELMPKLAEIDRNPVVDALNARKIRERYFGPNGNISLEEYQKFFDFYTERSFLVPLYQMLDQHLHQNNIAKAPFYIFKFSFPSALSYSFAFSGTFRDFGVVHCDELIYLLKTPVLFPEFPKDSTEARMRSILVRYLTAFAYYGMPIKPLYDSRNLPVLQVSDMKSTSRKYINFSRENKNSTEILFETVNDLDSDTVKFWMEMEGRIQSRKGPIPNRIPEVIAVHL